MNKKINQAIFLLIIVVTVLGLPLTLFSPEDASWFASIAKTMTENNDFINLYCLGTDWLDKPHLPFWLTAISFKILGFTEIAYKLPAVLVFCYGVYITYKFSENLYDKQTAIFATIILVTSLHTVISNFDVRAEPYLTTFVVAGLYWFYRYVSQKKISYLVLGSLFCAFALMTKGIFAIIPIIAGLGGHFLATKNYKEILNPKWLLAGLLILIFIIPELVTLYLQFDLHPEKVVFNKTNVSGIKFFFWDSQFGRFFNNGPIQRGGDIFFFIHTILWAFLPWSILFYIVTFFKIKRNTPKVNKNEEFYTLFATLFTLLIFSLSKFQLAHYTNIVFPFMSILIADFIVRLTTEYKKMQKPFVYIQSFLMFVVVVAIIVLSIVMKSSFNWLFIVVAILCGITVKIIYDAKLKKHLSFFYLTTVVFCFLYGYMFTNFYPTILQYQGGVSAARYINESDENAGVLSFPEHKFGFEFYLKKPLKRVDVKDVKQHKGELFFITENGKTFLNKLDVKFKVEKEFKHNRATKLTFKYMNPKTREKTYEKRYLIRLQ